MDYTSLISQLKHDIPDLKIDLKYSLAPYTTLKIGGSADIFLDSTSSRQFEAILRVLNLNSVTPTILGNGSNVLIADSGIRGVVIRNSGTSIDILDSAAPVSPSISTSEALRSEGDPQEYLDFTKIDYDESNSPPVAVTISSGTSLPYALTYLLDRGITGLQWFAYIPGTIGGAVWYNIHGGKYNLNQFLESVTYFDLSSGKTVTAKATDLTWNYDNSSFQSHPDRIILEATFNLYRGDADRARKTALAWISQKSKVQPMNSAGSVFQNPTLTQCLPLWGEQKSTGWIIDTVLGLKGLTIGGAQIGPQHANIFTNQGGATSSDFMALIDRVRTDAKNKLNLDLKLEINLLGF
jgi:UDP-N-acetylmuramate dehydrogenase